ncbi:putative hydrolase [Providencia alcalifaciens]|nr:putative hydrolase [Providencia alcalifaciens]
MTHFMAPEVVPDLSHLPANIEYQMTEHGGHVGFVGGSFRKPQMWLETRIPLWLTSYLNEQKS